MANDQQSTFAVDNIGQPEQVVAATPCNRITIYEHNNATQDYRVRKGVANAKGNADISVSTYTAGNVTALTTTTATNIVAFTPTAITTIWNARLAGQIENPSNALANVINIMAKTGTAADTITVKRGSSCQWW